MDCNRSYFTLTIRLAAVSAVVLSIATISAHKLEENLDFFPKIWAKNLRSFSPEKQAELDMKGDQAIASLKSSFAESDLGRVLHLKKSVLLRCPPLYRRTIQTAVPQNVLVEGVARVLRLELGVFYSGQRVIEHEEFEQTFHRKIYPACQQLHSKLGDWWEESSKGKYAENNQFEWLVAENICRLIIVASERDEFIQQAYKEFKHSLNFDLVQMSNYEPPKLAAKVDLIMRTVEPIDVARLSLLGSCITVRSPDSNEGKPFRRISDERLVRGLAAFMRFETDHPETAPDQASIVQLILKQLFEPCKAIHAQFHQNWDEGDDNRWAKLEGICLTFADIVESGQSNKILERVYIEYKRQLDVSRSDLEHRNSESMCLIHM